MRWLIPFLFLPLPALATEVDLELVLLADASGSIDAEEIAFQRQGYAAAITHPDVLRTIGNTLTGSIAVVYVEWAADQQVVVDWTIIDSDTAAADFARRLLEPPRLAFGRNAIGAALMAGRDLIEGNAITGLRRVIDFSGDSVGNFHGPAIEPSRDAVVAAGITINGLPILRNPDDSGLVAAYEARIIGGPGAFVVAATSRATFAEAIRRKLILEIAGETLPGRVAAADQASSRSTLWPPDWLPSSRSIPVTGAASE